MLSIVFLSNGIRMILGHGLHLTALCHVVVVLGDLFDELFDRFVPSLLPFSRRNVIGVGGGWDAGYRNGLPSVALYD